MMPLRLIGLTALCGSVLLTTTACSSSEESPAESDQPQRQANIDLPPVPPLPLLDVPAEYPDGSRSIMGLLVDRDDLFQTQVEVSGVVTRIYECSEPLEDGEEWDPEDGPRPGCNYPHLFIADAMESPREIIVTGYDAAHYEPQLEVGLRYRFSGFYTVQSRGFTASEYGLIDADTIEGNGVEAPPPPEDAP